MQQVPVEFECKGEKYCVNKMDLLDQLDLGAMLTPILKPFAAIAREDERLLNMIRSGVLNQDEVMKLLFLNIEKFCDLIAEMPKKNRHEIIGLCLGCVSYQPKGAVGWQLIWDKTNNRLQYEELNDVPKALAICWHVIQVRLKGFFGTGQ